MRQWIDLFESRYAPLYHGTSVTSALEILLEDRLAADGFHISLTREHSTAVRFADIKSSGVVEEWLNYRGDHIPEGLDGYSDEVLAKYLPVVFCENSLTWGDKGGMIFTIDQSLLRQRYAIYPYADDPGDGKWEKEERVRRDIKPFRPLIQKIEVSRNFRSIVNMVIHGDEQEGVEPQPQYREVLDFILTKV